MSTQVQAISRATDRCGELKEGSIMFVSGVVASVALIGIMAALFVAGLVLAYVDKRCDKGRQH